MRSFGRRFYIEAMVLFVAGVMIVYSSIYLRDLDASTMEIYYFFSPDCPNCNEVQPFINELRPELLKKKVRFIPLNTKDSENWDAIYKYLAFKISEKLGTDYLPTPTAIIRFKGRFYTLIGKNEVLQMNDFLHLRAGTRLVKAALRDQKFRIEECIGCHEARNLPPPSAYNCTFCCHRGSKKI